MITKYLTHLTTTFNPLSKAVAHRTPRLLLSFLPANARTVEGGGVKIASNVLPGSSTAPSKIVVGFKDGKEIVFEELTRKTAAEDAGQGTKGGALDLAQLGIRDVIEEVNRHSRFLGRKEELGG